MTARRLGDLGVLRPAEERLLEQLDAGSYLQFGDGRLPAADDDARAIRAELLRLVLLRGQDVPRLHENGLRLRGAWITGTLDLDGCHVGCDIALADCRLDAAPILQAAAIDTLLLDGCVLPGLRARRLQARGSAYLRAAQVNGEIAMLGARIGGELALDGSRIDAAGGTAFDASHVTVRGDLSARGARIAGRVRLVGADLAGDLAFVGTGIAHTEGTTLQADGLRTDGDVSLQAARMEGEASFIGARVSGDFRLDGGRFEAKGGRAVTLNRAVVEGAFFLRDEAKVNGALSLSGTTVGTVVDEAASWPARGDLLLNRFSYGGFLGGPVDARARLDWLARQDPTRWGDDFWPQPYAQLSAVLDGMGHQEEARSVLFEKERLQRRAHRARVKRPALRGLLLVKDWLLWATVGYGLQPLIAFIWLLGLWLTGVALFGTLQAQEQLRPNVPVTLRAPEWVLCATPRTEQVPLVSIGATRPGLAAPGQSQLACFLAQPEAASFPKFNRWMYALETLVPGLEAGQRGYWSPDTRFTLGYAGKLFEYGQRIIGLALGLLAFAGFSGIVKSR